MSIESRSCVIVTKALLDRIIEAFENRLTELECKYETYAELDEYREIQSLRIEIGEVT